MGEALSDLFGAECIRAERLDYYWPLIMRELERHPEIWEDYWTPESLYGDVVNGMLQLWGFGDEKTMHLVVFTRIAEYPAARHLHIVLALGDEMDKFLPLMEATFERFAMASGCRFAEISNARPGWERKLRRFRRRGVVLRCDVPKETIQ